jgi:hypothetical protein
VLRVSHQSRVGFDFDLIGNLTKREHRVDHRIAAHIQHDSRLNISFKTRQCRFQLVSPDGQIRQGIGTRFNRNDRSFESCLDVGCRHLNSRQNRAARVFDRTTNLAGRLPP